jgi:hypothetical protein
LTLAKPLTALLKGKLTVSVKDRQGNISRVERRFSVNKQWWFGVPQRFDKKLRAGSLDGRNWEASSPPSSFPMT